MGNRWLNDQMSGVAKRTIGLNRWPVRVRVHDLHDPAESNKCTAEKAEHYPQQVAVLRLRLRPGIRASIDPVLLHSTLL